MPKRFILHPALGWNELTAYNDDVVGALRLYFSPASPGFAARFVGRTREEVRSELQSRLNESDLRSALAVLTSLEARFQIDFDYRCRKRLKDSLSQDCRKIKSKHKEKVPLDEILAVWKKHGPHPAVVSELRGAFKFRHWLAHGRYWERPKLGGKYDFFGVQLIARGILTAFPLEV